MGDHRDYHESGFRSPDGIPLGVPDPSRYSLPPSHRSPRHSPRSAPFSRSPSDRGSPSASPPPTHNKIERAFTQPDLTSYRVGLVRTPSLQEGIENLFKMILDIKILVYMNIYSKRMQGILCIIINLKLISSINIFKNHEFL